MHRKGNRYDFIWTSMEYNERTKGDYLRPYKQTWFQSPYNHQFKTQQLHNHEYAWEAVYYFKLYGRQRCKIYSINVLSGSSYTKLLPPGQEAKIPSLGEGILREGLPPHRTPGGNRGWKGTIPFPPHFPDKIQESPKVNQHVLPLIIYSSSTLSEKRRWTPRNIKDRQKWFYNSVQTLEPNYKSKKENWQNISQLWKERRIYQYVCKVKFSNAMHGIVKSVLRDW